MRVKTPRFTSSDATVTARIEAESKLAASRNPRHS